MTKHREEENEINVFEINEDGSDVRAVVVQTRRPDHQEVCIALTEACISELIDMGVPADKILLVTVASATDIPFALKKLAEVSNISQDFNVLIAVDVIYRAFGLASDFEFNELSGKINLVSINNNIPIIQCILTSDENHIEGSLAMKGRDSARAAVQMANFSLEIDTLKRKMLEGSTE